MITVFVYEYLSGGGLLTPADCPALPESMLREGRAMLEALAQDFAELAGCRVVSTWDATCASPPPSGVQWTSVSDATEHQGAFDRLVTASDWSVLIAPETDGVLLGLARRAKRLRGDLLSPSPALVEIASSKQLTADFLQRAGVPCPAGTVWDPAHPRPTTMTWPRVIKPIDGAGSQSVRLVRSATELESALASLPSLSCWRLEPYVPGFPVSVAVVAVTNGMAALPACGQRLGDSFAYGGGWLPLSVEMDQRARQLALRAVGALPRTVGWVGVDLVLGPTEVDDRVIEVNPRLTTSYLGLRAAAEVNLAGLMLSAVDSERVVELSFARQCLEFELDGTVEVSRKDVGG